MDKAKYYVMLVGVTLIWGATPACGKILSTSLSPLLITGMRFAIISLVLTLWLVLSGQAKQLKLTRQMYLLMAAMGFVGITVHNGLLFTGLHFTTATNAALIESIGPTATTVLAFIFIGERLTKFGWLGIFVSCCGALCIVTKGSLDVLLNLKFNVGDILIVVCEVAWSYYIILGWKTQGRVKTAPLNAISGAFGAVFCFIAGAVTGTLEVYSWSYSAFYGFAYLTICSGLIAFIGWNWAVNKVGASKAGSFIYIVPLTGAIVGVLFLGETLHLSQVLGALLIIGGVTVTVRSKVSINAVKEKAGSSDNLLEKFPELKAEAHAAIKKHEKAQREHQAELARRDAALKDKAAQAAQSEAEEAQAGQSEPSAPPANTK